MRRIAVPLIALLAVAGAFVLVARPFSRGTAKIETATVIRGTLESTVELAGSVAPQDSRSLTFGTAGVVASVSVKVGEQVTAGQELAALDEALALAQVQAAEAALASAEARLAADNGGLTPAQLAQAMDPVDQARTALETARDAEASAKSQWADSIPAAQATLDRATAKLAADTQSGAPEATLAVDRSAVQAAEAALETTTAQADTAVEQAGAAVRSARAALTAAQHAYAVRTAPATEALIAADEAAVASSRASLAAARQTLALAVISSPIPGTVTEVGLRTGDRTASLGAAAGGSLVGGGTGGADASGRIVIQDLSDLRVRATASEIDVVSLSLDQSAAITLDALPDLRLEATICELGATGSSSQGVVEYPITLCLASGDARLRVGMSANISILLARVNDVLIVPTPAVRTVDGRSVVRVVAKDGTIREVPVEVGVSTGTRLEIRSGLSEGDRVVVGGTTTGSGN